MFVTGQTATRTNLRDDSVSNGKKSVGNKKGDKAFTLDNNCNVCCQRFLEKNRCIECEDCLPGFYGDSPWYSER